MVTVVAWWGDQIPDASIVKDLEFVSIDTGGVTKMWCAFDWGLCRGEKPHITLLEEDPISKKIAYKSDTEIVSEIISIFFEKTMSEKKNALANAAAEDIRSIVLKYLNDKKAL